MTSKERAKLKSIASTEDTILQVGKNPISPEMIKQVDDALNARELIKMRVLETSELSVKEAAVLLAEKTNSEVVQTIGNKLVLFRRRPKSQKKPSLLDDVK